MADSRVRELSEHLDSRRALLIAGPTASGKSGLALAVAERCGAAIINVDSMQIYSGLRILTARPTVDEEARAPHHLYGTVDPAIAFSVGDYLRLVTPLLHELKWQGRPAILVGGTGLYFRALTEGLVETPPVDADTLAALAAEATSGADLHTALMREDPEMARKLNPADKARIGRALAVIRTTGISLSDWQGRSASAPPLEPGSWAGVFLDAERAGLFKKIDHRFAAMISEGALDEARTIQALKLPPNRGVMKAHGLPHLITHLEGKCSLDEAIQRGQQDTRRYAKRQVTWARKYMAKWTWMAV